jgi:hypothetical protein
MSDKPRYTFSDVNGVIVDGTNVDIGIAQGDVIDILFDYRDSRDGVDYHVQATGYRTKKESQIAT